MQTRPNYPRKGLTYVWLNQSYLILIQGERKEHSFGGTITPSHVIEMKIAKWCIFRGSLRKEKYLELTQNNTPPNLKLHTKVGGFIFFILHMTCLLIFVHGLWGKKWSVEKLVGPFWPNDSCGGRIAWSPAQNSLPVLYTGLEISTGLSVQHELKST